MSLVVSTVFCVEFNGIDGSSGAAPVNIPELRVGDLMFLFQITASGGGGAPTSGSYFVPSVSVDGQLQQSAALDLTSMTFKAAFFRGFT
jgi:hypothetical protein